MEREEILDSVGLGKATLIRDFLVRYGYTPQVSRPEEVLRGLELSRQLLLPQFGKVDHGFLLALARYARQPRCGRPDATLFLTLRASNKRFAKRDIANVAKPEQSPEEVLLDVLRHRRLPFVDRLRYPLRYWVDPTPPSGVTLANLLVALREATDLWGSVMIGRDPIFTFERTEVEREAHIKFLWRDIDRPGSEIANGEPAGLGVQEGVLRFDRLDPWSAADSLNKFHVATIAVHEIGHALGLEHIYGKSGPPPSMNPAFFEGADFRLGLQDREALIKLYRRT